MHDIKDLLKFLKSVWGLLAATTVLFPGAAALLKLQLAVEKSKLATLYGVIPTIIAAFALLLLAVIPSKMASLKQAFCTSLVSFAMGLLLLFGFVTIRNVRLDVVATATHLEDTREEYQETRDRGLITIVWPYVGAPPNTKEYGDPWDIVALACFTASMASFTVAFGALGIHAYVGARPSS